jgi:hypothetical protein
MGASQRFDPRPAIIPLAHMAMQLQEIAGALRTLGAVLEDRRTPYGLLVVGGGDLLLLGFLDRPTADLDVIAVTDGASYRKATELPEPLKHAARDVAEALEISEHWLNNGPASLMDLGLPPGWEERVERPQYGALEIHLTSRYDQICFKLYAVDRGPNDKHFQDLLRLAPTREELSTAASWTQTHDPSDLFRTQLEGCLAQLGVELGRGAS